MRLLNPDIAPARAREILDGVKPSPTSKQTVTAHCKLITPMYGGGVKAGKVDRDMPIRASALRGQLRFWWRLLNCADRTPQELFAAESELWGGISRSRPRASRVALRVKNAPVGDHELITKRTLGRQKPKRLPDYALILKPGEDPDLLDAGYTFDFVLHFEKSVAAEQQKGVIEALRWWASFAGVGARTRRGLGAVSVDADGKKLEPVLPEDVARRGGRMAIGRPTSDATKAWSDAIGALQEFRQGPRIGRNPGLHDRPGRSRWPEADAIRRLTNSNAPLHKPEHPVDGFFPRASFGLPLVFHFKDRGDPKGKNDGSLVLNPAKHERMASPLILRPWFDGQRYRPAALLLPGWEDRVSVPVRLDQRQETPAWPQSLDEREQLAQQIEPMQTQNAADALTAFMDYFKKQLSEQH